jgi:hypothetical protein
VGLTRKIHHQTKTSALDNKRGKLLIYMGRSVLHDVNKPNRSFWPVLDSSMKIRAILDR